MPDQPPPERRPIKSRNTRWASAATNLLVKSGVSPNAISLAGMFAAIAAGCAFFATSQTTGLPHRALWLAAAALCQVRLLGNLFDGMVALARGTASPLGELYTEVPDRISDAAVFIGLGYAAASQPELGYLAALTSLFTAYIRATAKAPGAPKTSAARWPSPNAWPSPRSAASTSPSPPRPGNSPSANPAWSSPSSSPAT